MKRLLSFLIAAMLITAMILPVLAMADESAYVGKTYYVKTNTGKGLNMRDECSAKSGHIIVSVPYGTALTVFNWCNNKQWAKVEYAGRVGYVYSRYLSATEPAPISKKTAPSNAKSEESLYAEGNPPIAPDIALRSNPSTGYSWAYTVDDYSAVRVVENGFHSDDENLIGAPGIETFRLDGTKFGFAEVKFYYVRAGEPLENALYNINYWVHVDENLEVIIYDIGFKF